MKSQQNKNENIFKAKKKNKIQAVESRHRVNSRNRNATINKNKKNMKTYFKQPLTNHTKSHLYIQRERWIEKKKV